MNLLKWDHHGSDVHQEAILAKWPNDGIRFSLEFRPSCYRRGPWRLLIEVCLDENHHRWGCFDDADQPERYYHYEESAKAEAEAIAIVLLKDRGGLNG